MFDAMWARLAAGAVAVLVVLGLLGYAVHHERQVGAERATVAVVQAAASQAVADAAETQRRVLKQQEATDAAEIQRQQAAAEADRARRSAASLRVQLAQMAAQPRAGDPVPACQCQTERDQSRLLSSLLGEAVDLAGDFASEADRNRIGWDACVRSYDALTPKTPRFSLSGP